MGWNLNYTANSNKMSFKCFVTITGSITDASTVHFRHRRHCFFDDRKFNDLRILANMLLKELAGFIRSLGCFKSTTNESWQTGLPHTG